MNNRTITKSFGVNDYNVIHSKMHYQYITTNITNWLLESETIINIPTVLNYAFTAITYLIQIKYFDPILLGHL